MGYPVSNQNRSSVSSRGPGNATNPASGAVAAGEVLTKLCEIKPEDWNNIAIPLVQGMQTMKGVLLNMYD